MALVLGSQPVGSILELRGPRDSTLVVLCPDEMELRMPAPTGRIGLWLAQPGTWHYRWEDGGDWQQLEVVAAPAPERPAGPATVQLTVTPRLARYQRGRAIWVVCTASDEPSAWVDPPHAERQPADVRRVSDGVFDLRLDPDVGGLWQVGFETSSAGAAWVELYVQP